MTTIYDTTTVPGVHVPTSANSGSEVSAGLLQMAADLNAPSVWRTLVEDLGPLYPGALTPSFFTGGTMTTSGSTAASPPKLFQPAPADVSIGSRTAKLRLLATAWANSSPVGTYTIGLYPVTPSGSSTSCSYTLGTVVAGSTISVSPSAGSVTHASSSAINYTALNGTVGYVLGAVGPGLGNGVWARVELQLSYA